MKKHDWHLVNKLDGCIARANNNINAAIQILDAINKAESTCTPDGELLSISKKALHNRIAKTERRISEAIDIVEKLYQRGRRSN